MASDYQLTANPHTIRRTADGAYIPDDPANRDFAEYTAWLEDGGVPDTPAPPSPVGVIAQSALTLSLSQARTLNTQGRTQEAVAAILDMLEKRP